MKSLSASAPFLLSLSVAALGTACGTAPPGDVSAATPEADPVATTPLHPEALTLGGETTLALPIGNCSDPNYPVCGGFVHLATHSYPPETRNIVLDAGNSRPVGKFQVKLFIDGNNNPLASTDDFNGGQDLDLGPWLPSQGYWVGIEGCKQDGSFNSWTCGSWFWRHINTPNFKWAGANDLAGFLDPTNVNIAPGGFDDDGTHLAVCRAHFGGGLHPGKGRAYGGTYRCNFGWGGSEQSVSQAKLTQVDNGSDYYEVLFSGAGANPAGTWLPAGQVTDWTQAFVGGTDGDHSDLYVCRGTMGSGFVPGKVVGGPRGGCSVGYGGYEQWIGYPYYQVYMTPPLASN